MCGRYEGFDERIRLGLRPREISIGDFVCNGGEVPAMVVIDTVIRYVPGVLGDPESVTEESHSEAGRLEYPQYTRPRVFRGMAVPEILLSGNHQAIARWRREQSEARSRPGDERNPTMKNKYVALIEGQQIESIVKYKVKEKDKQGNEVEKELTRHIDDFQIGDTVDVHLRILEGEKERVQVFTRRRHFPPRRRRPRDVHGAAHRAGRGRRAHLPAALAADRQESR